MAQSEREKYERRCKAMDEWLMQKKIEEAEKVANLREMDRREEAEKQMRDEKQTSSYKEWMRLQMLKKKQTRKYQVRQQKNKEDIMARQLAHQEEIEAQMRREREDNEVYDREYVEAD